MNRAFAWLSPRQVYWCWCNCFGRVWPWNALWRFLHQRHYSWMPVDPRRCGCLTCEMIRHRMDSKNPVYPSILGGNPEWR